jgi:hypothetical protein
MNLIIGYVLSWEHSKLWDVAAVFIDLGKEHLVKVDRGGGRYISLDLGAVNTSRQVA